MGKCKYISFILSGVVLAGVGFILYTPLPDTLANRWQLQKFNMNIKVAFMWGELRYRLGIMDNRMASIRMAINNAFLDPLTEADTKGLKVYDTRLNGVLVRVYKPLSAREPMPGLIFYHGGGWIVFNRDTYDRVCAHIAKNSNIIVINVEFRLSPEHPFPAGFDDCVNVAMYALTRGKDLGLDSNRIAVAGDSSGGNLAAAVALKFRNENVKPPLKAQLHFYSKFQICNSFLPIMKIREPNTNQGLQMFALFFGSYFNMTESQKDILRTGRYLTPEMQTKCEKLVDLGLLPSELIPKDYELTNLTAPEINEDVRYINTFMDDPRVAPMMVEDFGNFPATFILTIAWDDLRDESIIFAKRLELAGNRVDHMFLQDSFHGVLNAFDFERYGFDAGPKVMDRVLKFIEKNLKS